MPDPDPLPPAPSALPAGLVDRARAYRAGREQPVPTRDSATVCVLRDGPTGIEAYLLRRVREMAFAAGMHVFPGGSVDPRDADGDLAWAGPPPAEWGAWFGTSAGLARALVCAAVRETFEESGLLLAGGPGTATVVDDTSGPEWEADRQALLSGAQSLRDLLGRRGLQLRADLLRPWTHWITPEFEPRRFDTRFFVAAMPPGQHTRDVGGEADRVLWVQVREAVAAHDAGRMEMLPPTIVTLREVAAYPTVADVLDAGARRAITPILPRPVWSGEEMRLLVPGDEGYDG